MALFDYEQFKKAVYELTGIDLSCYKEKQIKDLDKEEQRK